MRIFIIDDDPIMTDCIGYAIRNKLAGDNAVADLKLATFTNAIDAMTELNHGLPDLILLDVLLSGPDGFSFLNELMTYSDTARIPIILITSLELDTEDLSHYGIVRVLQKETMTPAQIGDAVQEALGHA